MHMWLSVTQGDLKTDSDINPPCSLPPAPGALHPSAAALQIVLNLFDLSLSPFLPAYLLLSLQAAHFLHHLLH